MPLVEEIAAGEQPLLVMRRNNSPWLAVLPFELFLDLLADAWVRDQLIDAGTQTV